MSDEQLIIWLRWWAKKERRSESKCRLNSLSRRRHCDRANIMEAAAARLQMYGQPASAGTEKETTDAD